MKIDPKIQYKSETGTSPFFELESKHLTESMSGLEFEGMTRKEIRDALKYDFRKNSHWGVFIMDLPEEYQECNDLKIHTPEYVEWLESRLEQLTAP